MAGSDQGVEVGQDELQRVVVGVPVSRVRNDSRDEVIPVEEKS